MPRKSSTIFLNATKLLIFYLVRAIAHPVVDPFSSNDHPKVLPSQPQPAKVTGAPAPLLLREAIEGRQAWNACFGYSLLGASGASATVGCPAPYTCLVWDHSIYPYWGCAVTGDGPYTACYPYGDIDYIYGPAITYW
jgi:hypothetical protein